MAQVVAEAPSPPARRVRDRSVLVPMLVGLAVTAGVWLIRRGIWFWGVDLSAYRAGGHAVLHGQPLYEATGVAVLPGLLFIYTPFAALLVTPLAVLGAVAAQDVWLGLNGLALGAVLWIAFGMAGMASGRRRTVAASVGTVLAVGLFPVLLNFELGQINILLLLLVLVDFSRLVPERWRGVAVGVAAGIKLTPLIFVAYWALTGRWRAAAQAMATFAITIVIGFVILPANSVLYWINGTFFDTARMVPPTLGWIVNMSLPGMFARLAEETTPPGWTVLLSAAVAALGLLGAVWAYRRGQDLVGVLITAYTSLLVSPIVWPANSVWALPVLVWLATATWRSGRTVLPRVVLVAALAWYTLPLFKSAERLVDSGPYQWTTAGKIHLLIFGYQTAAVLVLALLWLWLPRLRPAATPVP